MAVTQATGYSDKGSLGLFDGLATMEFLEWKNEILNEMEYMKEN